MDEAEVMRAAVKRKRPRRSRGAAKMKSPRRSSKGRRPYPRTKQNIVTLPSRNRPTNINKLRRTVN